MTKRERERRLRGLARDIYEQMPCICNDDGRPMDCDCGGDGPSGVTDSGLPCVSDEGCWRCQAYTALHGFGKPPKEDSHADR